MDCWPSQSYLEVALDQCVADRVECAGSDSPVGAGSQHITWVTDSKTLRYMIQHGYLRVLLSAEWGRIAELLWVLMLASELPNSSSPVVIRHSPLYEALSHFLSSLRGEKQH